MLTEVADSHEQSQWVRARYYVDHRRGRGDLAKAREVTMNLARASRPVVVLRMVAENALGDTE